MPTARLLEIKDLRVEFKVYGGVLKVLDGVNFSVNVGEKVGLVLSLIHISEPTRLVHSSRMPSSA